MQEASGEAARHATATAAPATNRWAGELGIRMLNLLPLKFVGVSAFTWLFFVAYFHLLRHPLRPAVLMPLTALDHAIPFQPSMLFAYLSLWIYVGIAPGLQLGFRRLVVYGLWISALCGAGLLSFYVWPTAVAPLAVDVSGMTGFSTLQGVDAAGNACPSMHVAVAIFSALWIDHLLRLVGAPLALRLVNAAWFLAIVWSTLAIKQHVVIDALAGALLGAAFAAASLRWRPRDGRVAMI